MQPLTVACVPTGMKAGSCTAPCVVCSTLRRAQHAGSVASKSQRRSGGAAISRRGASDSAGSVSRGLHSDWSRRSSCTPADRPRSCESARPSVVNPNRTMHLRARTERFRSAIGRSSTACSSGDRSDRSTGDFRFGPTIHVHAQVQPAGVQHIADFDQRRLAKILARQQLHLGNPGQIAQRPDPHLLQAIATAHRQLEIGHRDAEHLVDPLVALLQPLRQRTCRPTPTRLCSTTGPADRSESCPESADSRPAPIQTAGGPRTSAPSSTTIQRASDIPAPRARRIPAHDRRHRGDRTPAPGQTAPRDAADRSPPPARTSATTSVGFPPSAATVAPR